MSAGERFRNPSGATIGMIVAAGLALILVGNIDRLFWWVTSNGAQLPGLVIELRSYRPPGSDELLFRPKVAFRDPEGKVRILETAKSSPLYNIKVDQPVLVKWQPETGDVTIDLPLQRSRVTSIIGWLLTSYGFIAVLAGVWMAAQRLIGCRFRMRMRS